MKSSSAPRGALGGLPVSSRGPTSLCVGLLAAVLLLQLYVIWLYFASPAAPPQVTARCPSQHTHTGSVLTTIEQQNSEQNKLKRSKDALSALHLLQKYIRMHESDLDTAAAADSKRAVVTGSAGMVQEERTPAAMEGDEQHEHGGHKQHEEPKSLLDGRPEVGQLRLGQHRESADGHSHGGEEHHDASDEHSDAYLAAHPDLYHSMWLNLSSSWAEDVLSPDFHHRGSEEDKERGKKCTEWYRTYNVHVDSSWGTLPVDLQKEFDALHCSDVVSVQMLADFIRAHPDQYNRALPVPDDRQKVQAEAGMEDKVIAIIASLTTRGLSISQPEDLALFKHLLPSLVDTAEEGFEYWFYLGYDEGDPYFDNEAHVAAAREWFAAHVTAPLQQKSIVAKLVVATWHNPTKSPGPAFNYVTGVAYADGATWIYRINDDVKFDTPWASKFVNALTAMGKPYGVVGPQHGAGNTRILVVDFLHRTHHEIFPTHYPPTLISWWMDDWITQVYGKKRTMRLNDVGLTHLTSSHGQRYNVEMAGYFRGEIVRGRNMLEEYMSHTPGMQEALKEYRSDIFTYNI